MLGFGWLNDILHIDISVHYIIDLNLFSEKRSVLGMLKKLWEDGSYWPWLLIFIFGIVVPLIKSGIYTGVIVMVITFIAFYFTEETFHKDLNYSEGEEMLP